MKEKFLALLRTKFEGVQDAVLQRVADAKFKNVSKTATEDEIQGIVDGLTYQDVIEDYANSRVTEASRTSVVNYEKKHGLKNGKPVQPGGQNPNVDVPDDVPDYIKTLMAQNQKLQEKIEGFETRQNQEALADRVRKKLSVKNIPVSFYKSRPLAVENEDEIDSLVDAISGDYDELKSELAKDGIVPDTPKHSFGSATGKSVDKDIEEWAGNSN